MKKYAHLAVFVLVLADVLAVIAAWSTAFFLRFNVDIIPVIKAYPTFPHYLSFVPIVLVFWLAAARLLDLYGPQLSRSLRARAWNAWKAATLSLVLLTALTFFYREFPFARFSRVVMAYYWIIITVYAVIARTLAQTILKNLRRRGYEVRRILIAGTGELGVDLGGRMRANEVLGIEVVGYLTDREEEVGSLISGVPVTGRLEDAREVILRFQAEQLLIALPMDGQDHLQRVLEGLGEELIDIKVVPDFLKFMKLNAGIEDFDGLPVISLRESPLFGVNRLVKRTADIVLSLAALLVLSPLMVLIAWAIKLTSPGPVLYRQERMGLDGISFQMFKFRSMTEGAEELRKDLQDLNEAQGPIFKIREDPRMTIVGRWIRRWSIDELTQLINVINGEMSLVGPRPYPITESEQFDTFERRRYDALPGITGLAQVSGRSDLETNEILRLDLYYIENWSIGLDIQILLKTLPAVFTRRGAY